jgi:hypothetical protein
MEKEFWVALLALVTALIGLVAAYIGRRKVHEVRVRRDDAATEGDKEVLAPVVKDATGKDYPEDAIPAAESQTKTNGTRAASSTRSGGESFRVWLVRTLREQKRGDAAEVAERLFAWADANGYQESGDWTASQGGSLRFAIPYAGQLYEVFAFGGKGEVQLPFQYMRIGPFIDHQMRREYRERVSKIPGVIRMSQRWESINGWPGFPLEVLHDPAHFRQFTDAVEWAAAVIRATRD